MATDMSEVVGEENMTPEAKETVIEKLAAIAKFAAHEAKHALHAWGRETGAEIGYADLVKMGVRKKRRP